MSNLLTTHATTFAPAAQPAKGLLLQRKCGGCGNHTGGSQCSGCAKKEEQKLQRRAAGIETVTEIPPIINEVLNSPGQPLDTATRAFMEPKFRHDFSSVRVHADARASESARSVNAQAFTVGSHVVFDAGKYAPNTTAGKNLLAHELTHVLQQSHGLTRSTTFGIGPANDEHERQADAVANAVVNTLNKPAVNSVRPLIPGTHQQVATSPAPPPRTRLQRRSAEDELLDPFTGGEVSQANDGGGGGGGAKADTKPKCPKVPTKLGDQIPSPACPTATHTGATELGRFNFCLDSDQLTDPTTLSAIPGLVRGLRWATRYLIHGYASPEGRRDYNFRLACHRAIRIAKEFRTALEKRLDISQKPALLQAEVDSRIETASQGPTSEFGKAESNRVVIVYGQIPGIDAKEPGCDDAPRHLGDIKPEINCDPPTKKLEPMEEGKHVKRFRFCLDSDVLTETSPADIRSFAYSQAAGAKFFVHGFASVEGPPDYNQRLSCHRALRIFRELINAGVKQEQITEVSGMGETSEFGEPKLNRVAVVFAEGEVGAVPGGTRPADTPEKKAAIRDAAVARIMAGQYNLGADAYISRWTCGHAASVRQAVERLTIKVPASNFGDFSSPVANGAEEGIGVNTVALSNTALGAGNAIECVMGRIIDMAFHQVVLGNPNLPTDLLTPIDLKKRVDDPERIEAMAARHDAGRHLIHLAGLSACTGPLATRARKGGNEIGIDPPLTDDPRKDKLVPICTEAPQPTRLHPPDAGAKEREAPIFEVIGTPSYKRMRGAHLTNFESGNLGETLNNLIATTDQGLIDASATVQLRGKKETFNNYEVGFIQTIIDDEMQVDYDSGHVVHQKLPLPIRLAQMKGQPIVPPPWTTATSMARPESDGKVEVSSDDSGLDTEAAIALQRLGSSFPNAGLQGFQRDTVIAIWLIARRLGAPLDRFSVRFLDGVTYEVMQNNELEHRRVRGDLDQLSGTGAEEHDLALFRGGFLTMKPSLLPEDPSSARLLGPVASEIVLRNQVHRIVEPEAATERDLDKEQLKEVVQDILDNLILFETDEEAKANKAGTKMPRLGFDFLPLTITMPFVRSSGRLENTIDHKIVIKVTGPGLGFDAAHAIARALEFRIRTRTAVNTRVKVRPSIISGRDATGDVTVTLPPISRKRGVDPKTDPDVTQNPEVLRSMAEAWDCTLHTQGFLFPGVEFCRAFWMDRDKQLRGIPEDHLVRGETKIENGGASVSECELPCLVAEAGTKTGVRLVGFHTHPEPSPEPSEADLRNARDCGAPTNFIITDNQAFRFTEEGLVDEKPIDLPRGVTCDPKNLEGFIQPPEGS